MSVCSLIFCGTPYWKRSFRWLHCTVLGSKNVCSDTLMSLLLEWKRWVINSCKNNICWGIGICVFVNFLCRKDGPSLGNCVFLNVRFGMLFDNFLNDPIAIISLRSQPNGARIFKDGFGQGTYFDGLPHLPLYSSQGVRNWAMEVRAWNYRPSFRENEPKTLVFNDWIRALWACFHENAGL